MLSSYRKFFFFIRTPVGVLCISLCFVRVECWEVKMLFGSFVKTLRDRQGRCRTDVRNFCQPSNEVGLFLSADWGLRGRQVWGCRE